MSLLIHPGFHKTGTTWLQRRLFSDARHFNMMFNHEEVDAVFLRPHDLEFSAEKALQAIKARRSLDDSKIDVISSEILSGQIFSGVRLSRITAQRLFESCGSARILLTVRAQIPITRSIYMQYLKRGGRLSIDRFLDYKPEPSYGWFNASVLQFGLLARHYGETFGQKNVLVLPQELLNRSRDLWLDHLFRFMIGVSAPADVGVNLGAREGVSPPASGIPLLRAANIFREGPLNPNAITSCGWIGDFLHRSAYRWKIGDDKAQRRINDAIDVRFSGKFAYSNRILQEYCPVDLAELGYELG